MAPTTYKLKSGNTISNLVQGDYGIEYRDAIPGNTYSAKLSYVMKLNNITNESARRLPVGYEVKLNENSTSSTSSSGSTSTNTNKVVITNLGLQCESETGRDFFADWTWYRHGKETKGYKVRWEWDTPDPNNPSSYITRSEENDNVEVTWSEFTIPEQYQETANWVQVFITPIANTYKSGDNDVPYWTEQTGESYKAGKQYHFSSNPPRKPKSKPSISINTETLMLTATIDVNAKELDAWGVAFNVVQDNSVSLGWSNPVKINNDISNVVTFQYPVTAGHTYTVRARTTNEASTLVSGWTEFSDEAGTQPSPPSGLTVRRDTHVDSNNDTKTYTAFLEWTPVGNVVEGTKYVVEYTTDKNQFDITGGSVTPAETEDSTPSIRIGISAENLGYTFYFRVKTKNSHGESEPSNIIELPFGRPPGPPTTWSTSNSAFVGETTYRYVDIKGESVRIIDQTPMELNWVHNPTDNSKQTFAEIQFNFNDEKDSNDEFVWNSIEPLLENETSPNDSNTVFRNHSYGTGVIGTSVSYKGDLYFKMDTNHTALKNKKIRWRVRTAGVDNVLDNDAWSIERTIYIYEKPELGLSMSSDPSGIDPNGTELIKTFSSFPFYFRGYLSLRQEDYKVQKPVGYHVQVVSKNHYVTVDDLGRTKTVNPGDAVYSKYFDTDENPLLVHFSADNIDLESSIEYVVQCTANMSTGLSVTNSYEFNVNWVDVEYAINADISIDKNSYTALITPYCREKIPTTIGEGDDAYTTYEDGDLVENVTLSVYRREYDGTYKEIASGIPNNYTSVTDPHPALDYARYRFTATDTRTGALSYWDMPGCPVNGGAVIIQWDEAWFTFDVGESTTIEGPSWTGSLLRLPYNIKTTDNRKRDKTLVNYAGREHPVSYYGTHLSESSTWSVDIPAYDKETIYALRRLSLWAGDVYVREPSGTGFWANVEVSFNQSYDDLKIPVSFNVTRVEGGV